MKWSRKTYLFFTLQLICFLVVPCVLIWLQYGGAELSTKYRLSVTSIMLFALVFLIAKKILLNPWLKKIDSQLGQIEVQQLAAVEPEAVISLKKRFRRLSLFQLFFNAVMPVLLLILAVMTIKVVEAGLIKLYGVLMFSAISIGAGVLFKVGEIYSVKCEHEGKAHEE